ncbi:MAG TPA: DUF6263 family protein [Kofleriaceae bacterium]
MRRSLFVLLFAAAACGGKQKSTTPPPPLPEPTAQTKPVEPPKQEPKKEEAPPVPKGPVELTLEAPKVTVKLVSAGKGKKAALKHSSKAGDKQAVELTMDFTGKQTLPPEMGGAQEQISPTVVLLADVESKEVAADGATKFNMTINGVDARDVPGAQKTSADYKPALASLNGATIAGSVNSNGSFTDLTLHIEKPDQHTIDAVGLFKLSLLPMWPVLPTEAIGAGAKWTVTTTTKVADRLEVTQTTDYQLVSKKGKAAVIKGTTKITGAEQKIEDAQFGAIGGSGTTEATINEGTLLPAAKQSMKTDFTATAEPQPNQKVAIVFHLEQANAVQPKGEGAAATPATPATPATKTDKATPATPATPAPKADTKATPKTDAKPAKTP